MSNGLPKHNKLVVVIDPDWKPTSDYCSVEGAESESDSVSILCFNGGSGNTYVVTGMAGLES